jgi:NAD-dependent dihydropyrimidine dehydrogenase PreA subunit
MLKRKIIRINEEKCTGCGLCIPNCKEGALQIIDGKARLVSESFCDGLGSCIGHCPQGAITIEERRAEEYDEAKACPGSKMMDFKGKGESRLSQWPVQIHLVPVNAPYFEGADLLVAADCVPFAYAGFHEGLLKGKVLLIGCPKLDDAQAYQDKIAQIFRNNKIKSVTCAHM